MSFVGCKDNRSWLSLVTQYYVLWHVIIDVSEVLNATVIRGHPKDSHCHTKKFFMKSFR